jgi:hypothetical protein
MGSRRYFISSDKSHTDHRPDAAKRCESRITYRATPVGTSVRVVCRFDNPFFSRKTVGYSLQLIGAGCLVVVALTHTFEAFHVFPWMHWGFEHSVGHYIDFWSAMLGFTLFPIGYFLHALTPDSKRCS